MLKRVFTGIAVTATLVASSALAEMQTLRAAVLKFGTGNW